MEDYAARLKKAVIDYDMEGIAALAKEALDHGLDPIKGIEEGLAAGIRDVGRRFGEGELFLPELVMAAEAMRAGVAVLEPRIPKGADTRKVHRVVLATVQDDIHEIGKNLVGTMLTASGFEVVDLGVNQPSEAILKRAEEIGAEIVGVSALMTTSMPRMKELITSAEHKGVRQKKRFIVGGAPVTEQYAKEIHSDGTAGDASGAVRLAHNLVGG
ncbi:MAG TPA: corrinoid protein [Thermoplasmata archaeon]|jgi:corrinoid protein of di/trimethylamine methyltransferase